LSLYLPAGLDLFGVAANGGTTVLEGAAAAAVAATLTTGTEGDEVKATLVGRFKLEEASAWIISLLTEPTTGRRIRVLGFLVAEANDGTTVLEGTAAAAVAAALAISAEDEEVNAALAGCFELEEVTATGAVAQLGKHAEDEEDKVGNARRTDTGVEEGRTCGRAGCSCEGLPV
jgi:hypothetical protein